MSASPNAVDVSGASAPSFLEVLMDPTIATLSTCPDCASFQSTLLTVLSGFGLACIISVFGVLAIKWVLSLVRR